jgi:hypothetical protein
MFWCSDIVISIIVTMAGSSVSTNGAPGFSLNRSDNADWLCAPPQSIASGVTEAYDLGGTSSAPFCDNPNVSNALPQSDARAVPTSSAGPDALDVNGSGFGRENLPKERGSESSIAGPCLALRRRPKPCQRNVNMLAFGGHPPYADIWSSSARMNTFLHSR